MFRRGFDGEEDVVEDHSLTGEEEEVLEEGLEEGLEESSILLEGEDLLEEDRELPLEEEEEEEELLGEEEEEEVDLVEELESQILKNAPSVPVPSALASIPYVFPDVVRNFILHLFHQIRERRVEDINTSYEVAFHKLTERYFSTSPWPPVQAVAALVDHDPVFVPLYRELYFRHIYSKGRTFQERMPTPHQRIDSFNNYCSIFAMFEAHSEILLPDRWLWDMIDEFLYQFQAFHLFLHKPRKSEEEISILEANRDVWSVPRIVKILQVAAQRAKDAKPRTLPYTFGYFSKVGLLRVHALLGDYYLALKSVDSIDLGQKELYTRVTGCYINLYYYMGFSYLMTRRYIDATRTFSHVLVYLNRTKQYHSRSFQYDMVIKKNQQLYDLLALCLCLCPHYHIDDNVYQALKEKNEKTMLKIQRGDEKALVDLFCYACPKFIPPAFPDLRAPPPASVPSEGKEEEKETEKESSLSNARAILKRGKATNHQLEVFLNDIREQNKILTIRSFLKLYTTIPLSKLAGFLDVDEATLNQLLLSFKHKTKNIVRSGGSISSGARSSTSDVEFYLDKDMVYIAGSKQVKRYGDFFIRHIKKFDEVIKGLHSF